MTTKTKKITKAKQESILKGILKYEEKMKESMIESSRKSMNDTTNKKMVRFIEGLVHQEELKNQDLISTSINENK